MFVTICLKAKKYVFEKDVFSNFMIEPFH